MCDIQISVSLFGYDDFTRIRRFRNKYFNRMTNSKSLRWGIIGCGSVTEVKSGPAYQNTDGFEVVAVMCRNQEKAADYAKRHNISQL